MTIVTPHGTQDELPAAPEVHLLLTEPERIDTRKTAFNDGRSVTFRWLKAERTFTPKYGTGEEHHRYYAELSIHHHTSRKAFMASLTVGDHEGGCVRISLFDSVSIHRASVARYSVKAREAFIVEALDRLRYAVEQGTEPVCAMGERVPGLFDTRTGTHKTED